MTTSGTARLLANTRLASVRKAAWARSSSSTEGSDCAVSNTWAVAGLTTPLFAFAADDASNRLTVSDSRSRNTDASVIAPPGATAAHAVRSSFGASPGPHCLHCPVVENVDPVQAMQPVRAMFGPWPAEHGEHVVRELSMTNGAGQRVHGVEASRSSSAVPLEHAAHCADPTPACVPGGHPAQID